MIKICDTMTNNISSSEHNVCVAFVGLACLDIVNVCKDYPQEDSDQRLIYSQIKLNVIQL